MIRNDADPAPLDRIDRAILAALQQNARLANKELSARVGLAESSCHERVKRLVQSGVLRGFHAEVDPRALGVGLQALVAVRLARHTSAAVVAAIPDANATHASAPSSRAIAPATRASEGLCRRA